MMYVIIHHSLHVTPNLYDDLLTVARSPIPDGHANGRSRTPSKVSSISTFLFSQVLTQFV